MIKTVIFLSCLVLIANCSPLRQAEEDDDDDGDENELDEVIEQVDEFLHELQDSRASRDEKYNLTYFGYAGRAEMIRWILAHADEEFVDTRIKVADWPALKPTAQPFGQLPILEVERKNGEKFTLGQSKAIAIYLASRFDLEGETETEEAFVNMYGEQLGDLFDAFNTAMLANTTQTLFDSTWPRNYQFFESRLQETGTGTLGGGDDLTWADLFLAQITDFLYDKKDAFLANYPNVKALDQRVRALPGIAKWISSRPADSFN